MTQVNRNLLANVAGAAWLALLGIAFVPVYIKHLGIEAYGLIGAFTAIQSFSVLVDAGLSTTLNRELARLSIDRHNAKTMRDLVRTLEIVYWTLAVLAAAVSVLIAPAAARQWVQPERLSPGEVSRALMLMGVNFAFIWPSTVYQGGLVGLQLQVRLNILTSILGTLRILGAAAVLLLVSPTLDAFFIWQIVVSLLHTAGLACLLWSGLPRGVRAARFSLARLTAVRRFATGVVGITLLALLLQQTDKLILSNLLSLTSFGYYTFAAVVAGSLARIVGPIHTTFFPRFTELVSHGRSSELTRIYHRACQVVSVAVLPVAVVLATFAPEIVRLWTRNPDLVANTPRLVTILVIGNALHALLYLPYALQLAHGWTRLAFLSNLTGVAVLVPGIFVATAHWEALGAALIWVALTAAYVFVHIPMMHRRLLPGEAGVWYVDDVGKPLGACLITTWIGWWLVRGLRDGAPLFAALAGVSLASFAAAGLSVPWMRVSASTTGLRLYSRCAAWLRLSPQ